MPFWIDTDNALGSPHGDVDDAFALAALLTAGAPVAALSSVAGNTSEPRAFANTRRSRRRSAATQGPSSAASPRPISRSASITPSTSGPTPPARSACSPWVR